MEYYKSGCHRLLMKFPAGWDAWPAFRWSKSLNLLGLTVARHARVFSPTRVIKFQRYLIGAQTQRAGKLAFFSTMLPIISETVRGRPITVTMEHRNEVTVVDRFVSDSLTLSDWLRRNATASICRRSPERSNRLTIMAIKFCMVIDVGRRRVWVSHVPILIVGDPVFPNYWVLCTFNIERSNSEC